MLIKREDQDDITILKLYGEMNRIESSDLKQNLLKLLNENRIHVVLDLEEIKFIGSFTIMTLLRMNREFMGAGGSIKLLRPRNVVKRFLSIGRVLELFDRYETRVDAIRSFQQDSPQSLRQATTDKLQEAGKRQRMMILRLIELLRKKGYFQEEDFKREMNRSSQMVFQVFRQELSNDPLKHW